MSNSWRSRRILDQGSGLEVVIRELEDLLLELSSLHGALTNGFPDTPEGIEDGYLSAWHISSTAAIQCQGIIDDLRQISGGEY